MPPQAPSPAPSSLRLLLIWDNASWPVSKEVKSWIRAHNRKARKRGGVRLLVCQLPTRSPWLNRLEPHWVHGKRAVVEPARKLTAAELMTRVCRYYGCEHLPHLSNQVDWFCTSDNFYNPSVNLFAVRYPMSR